MAKRFWQYMPQGNRHSIRTHPRRPGGIVEAGSSSFVRHEPCPKCGSQDNLGRYDDGHAYCFTPGCPHFEPGKAGEDRSPLESARTTRPSLALLRGEAQALPERHLSLETCRRFQYWVSEHAGMRVEIANFHNLEGQRVAQKVRATGKRFHWRGLPGQAQLFGQSLWEEEGKRVVVTEGELDAMSVAQVMGRRWPAVSVPNGAAAAVGAVRRAREWLSSFGEVVFLFDQDHDGREAAIKCARVFPMKARLAILPLKDANEMLVDGRVKELLMAIWNAKGIHTQSTAR